ncbi:MAG: hypothetical protein Q9219_006291 [cf. Caloplaca sp. 3 TL-2023]
MYQHPGYNKKILHNLPLPAPPPEMHPLPPRLPRRPLDDNLRGGDSWRPSVPQSDFSFRNDSSAPQYPPQRERDRYRPSDDRPRRNNNNNRYGDGARNRGRGGRWSTAARPLLSSNRENSPENMLAQGNAQSNAQRFLPAGDVTDSDEADMEESESEEQPIPDDNQQTTPTSIDEDEFKGTQPVNFGEVVEPPTKRRATHAKKKAEAIAVPKWSNPDPYTVLPPLDESQRKRKDVVKIIRRARLAAEKEIDAENQVAANDDFISFGLEADDDSKGSARSSSPEPRDGEHLGVPGAPTGPRAFSHLNNLHDTGKDHAPGTFQKRPSANDLGPPPGLVNGSQVESDRGRRQQVFYPDQAEALGNRKRTFNDDIRADASSKGGGKKAAPSGSVLRDWIPRGDTNPTPWLVGDHRPTENPGFRLHKEVCDFYDFVRPQRCEQILREDLLQRLQVAVKKRFPDCDLYCFGSFAAAMYLPNADMDLVIISSTFRTSGQRTACQTSREMYSFAHYLEHIGLAKSFSTQVIFHAKVPIIKFVDHMTRIHVDVSFENETGLVANETFSAWKHQFPAMPILTTVIKQFLKMRGLGEVVSGGLGGFSVTCLVTSLLQNLPRVQLDEVVPEHNLGEMLLEFLDLYGNQFDLARTGISMSPPGYYDKQAADRYKHRQDVYQGNQGERLAIKDPNNRDNDISGGSKNVSRIFELFSEARQEIFKAMRSPNRISLLDWALGGDYGSIAVQRQHLHDLYRTRWGDPDLARTLTGLSHLSGSSRYTYMKENIPPTRLARSMFSNPMNPNVVVQPKQKAPKKPKGKKKKNVVKDGAKPTVPKSVEASSVMTRAMHKNKDNARKLKERFPPITSEIPDSVLKQEQRSISKEAKRGTLTTAKRHARFMIQHKGTAVQEQLQHRQRKVKKSKKETKKSKKRIGASGTDMGATNLPESIGDTRGAKQAPIMIE